MDAKTAPLAHLALDFQPTVMLLDDTVNGGKPQTGATANWFGRKERFENPAERRLVHAATGVCDCQHNKLALTFLWMPSRFGIRNGHTTESQMELASFGHRLARVDREVRNHLFQAGLIAVDPELHRLALTFQSN